MLLRMYILNTKNFNDIVNYADKENAVLGFAHPAYTIQNFRKENQLKNMQYLINIDGWDNHREKLI